MKDFAVVKGREFLTCRTFRRIGDEIIEAARSFELPEIKRNPNKIRLAHFVDMLFNLLNAEEKETNMRAFRFLPFSTFKIFPPIGPSKLY